MSFNSYIAISSLHKRFCEISLNKHPYTPLSAFLRCLRGQTDVFVPDQICLALQKTQYRLVEMRHRSLDARCLLAGPKVPTWNIVVTKKNRCFVVDGPFRNEVSGVWKYFYLSCLFGFRSRACPRRPSPPPCLGISWFPLALQPWARQTKEGKSCQVSPLQAWLCLYSLLPHSF